MTQIDRLRMRELREDAAMWFALMRGPEAEAQRAHFETWLLADPAHRQAYNHVSEVFSLGKGLKPSSVAPDPGKAARRLGTAKLGRLMGSPIVVLVLCVVAVPVVIGLTTSAMRAIGPRHPLIAASGPAAPGSDATSLVTAPGDVREFRLADGSRVILDADSRVEVALSPQRRDLALLRGRARFFVAHEPRPFVVTAGGGSILARGTIFDVALRGAAGASVDLIEGVVDVRQPPAVGTMAASSRSGGAVIRLSAGHGLAIGGVGDSAPRITPLARTDWPSALRDFTDVPLRELIAEANRYAARPIELADPALGDLRVSGTFRIREPNRLAGNLAALLDLSLEESPSAIVLAHRCKRDAKNSCPPS